MISTTVSAEVGPRGQRPSGGWYPIAADVAYKSVGMGGILIEGRGRSVKISSSGILIATEAALPLGTLIEIVIAWPAKLDDGACLNLHVRGRTLRSYGNHTAVAIIRYEFRTRASAVNGVQKTDGFCTLYEAARSRCFAPRAAVSRAGGFCTPL
jgi:hypothetical protein